MRRIDLVAAFVSAALRLDRVAMRDWLRKRLRNRPLAAPIDLARFAISDADIALILRAAGEAAAGLDRDEPMAARTRRQYPGGSSLSPHILRTVTVVQRRASV